MNMFTNMSIDSLTGIPSFFDFIEADISKIFAHKGAFIVFNVFNLMMINEKYGNNTGDLCISSITKSINTVISKYPNLYGFRFAGNDFIITMPNYSLSNVYEIASEVEEEFNKSMYILGHTDVRLYKYSLEYNQNINTIEEFYEFLLKNVLKISGNQESIDRIIKHLVGTFTRNIKNTSSLALKDDVSGLSNHRAGKLFISYLINQQAQCKKGFSVMFIDGDNLKRYNQISYEAGNQIIRKLSQIITDSMRTEDKVFRWLSGDEFLVVLKGIDKKDSLNLAELIRKAVEEQTQDCVYPTTISIGMAHFPSDDNCIEGIIKKAEKANSYAKINGKNKVVGWDTIEEDKAK